VIYAGDENLSDQQQNPELYDEGDPIDYPCEECGAEPGEECRPSCTGPSSEQWQGNSRPQDEEPPNVVVRQCPGWWPALVHAICEDCGWIGPTRDQNEHRGRLLIRCDRNEHRCG
jgi:hypothetical protein